MTVESTEHLQRRVHTHHVHYLCGATVPGSGVIYHRFPSSGFYGLLPHPAQVISHIPKTKGHCRLAKEESILRVIAPAQQKQSPLIFPCPLTSSGYSIANIFRLSSSDCRFHSQRIWPLHKFQICIWLIVFLKNTSLFPPRIELRTFSVLGRCDNHYTMETSCQYWIFLKWLQNTNDGLPKSKLNLQYLQICNAQRGARTPDPEIKSLMLYRLS